VRATESLLAYIAISKVLDRQPLYHIEKKLDREHHWNIPRQTMAKWLIRLADPLNPLLSLMKDVIIDYDIAHVDATGLQVLNEPNRPAESKSYAYCIRGGPPDKQVILFDYTAYNNQDYIVETFEGFEGVIHSDAASVYNKIGNRQEIQMSYCHAHARRKFETVYKAIKKKGGLAKEALIMYKALYKLERFATDQGFTPQKRYELRQEKSKPILTKHKQWLQDNQAKTMPKSPIGKAIAYSLNYWDELQVFLTDGRLEIDNNSTERQIKYFVMGRKNFMFACTPKCADSLGLHFSLILTAKQHGLDPYKYYVHIFKKIPYCKSFEDYEKLLPWNCKGIL
jgi:transposase